jgi:hypothetical protein
VPQSCAEQGRAFWQNVPLPASSMPTDEEMHSGEIILEELCKKKMNKYQDLVNKLLDAIESGNL